MPPILTAEEIEVFRLVVRGFTIREIARELALTPNKVKGHIRSVYRQLDHAGMRRR